MDKFAMREWVASLEQVIDNKLNRWKKESRIENGEVVQVEWQFEQTHAIIDIFWKDKVETVQLTFFGPRTKHYYIWHGLDDKTFNRVMDRVGNLAQITMHPPIEPNY